MYANKMVRIPAPLLSPALDRLLTSKKKKKKKKTPHQNVA